MLAVLAIGVIGVMTFGGGDEADLGGTIGEANRYQSETKQMTSDDVDVAPATAATGVMQTAIFDKIVNDPKAMKAFKNDSFRQALASEGFRQALDSESLRQCPEDNVFLEALKSEGFGQALMSEDSARR